ncbi:hypothetical protein Tco_0679689 [Tanacetum coccineum]|uniref:Retrovirus-related Pol polyprotein from transposon TNT 1-94-like beta-barrel domain-containing protein n=1 Tax=Tanacetum coccineum TaxID=301880 RepID=A0ABQ4XJS2_9ASTR
MVQWIVDGKGFVDFGLENQQVGVFGFVGIFDKEHNQVLDSRLEDKGLSGFLRGLLGFKLTSFLQGCISTRVLVNRFYGRQGTKFDIEKFDGTNDFGLWQVRMKALLEQQGLAAALEELPAATIVAYDSVIQKKAYSALILCLGKNQSEHIDEFHKLVGDLTAIDTVISDEDQALLLLTSLPSSYDNFAETLLYGRDTLKLEDVLATLNSRELQKITKVKGDGGEGLNEDQVSSSGADGYDNADVMMAMSVEELLDWIMDSGSSYYITYRRDYLVDFKEYDGGNILLGDGRECRVQGTGKVQVQMRDGSSFVLDNVRYVSELRRNLISLGTLEKEGFTEKMQSGKIKVIKGSLVVLSGTRRANCVYTLDGQAVTRKTLKGRKQLGEYQTGLVCPRYVRVFFGWLAIKQGMLKLVKFKCIFLGYRKGIVGNKLWRLDDVTSKVLQGVKFDVEPHEDHTFEVEPHRNVDHVVGSQEVQTQDLIYYHPTRDREQHPASELFSYREDSNEAAFAVAEAEKIYAHESLTFNNTIAYEVISKKCSDDSDIYYWEYTPGMFIHLFLYIDGMVFSYGCKAEIWVTKGLLVKAKENVLGMEIVRDQCGDCDVEKNGKWSCIYAVGSQEYQMVCTRLDIASADVAMMLHMMALSPTEADYMTHTEAAKEAIWLKGLAIESGFELKIVVGIATGALSKAIPGSRFQH